MEKYFDYNVTNPKNNDYLTQISKTNKEKCYLAQISEIKRIIEEKIENRTLEPFRLNVELSRDRGDVEYDQLFLQYCMPIIHMANKYAEMTNMPLGADEPFAVLNIILNKDDQKKWYPNISHYFTLQQIRKVRITVNGDPLIDFQTRFGKIPPMMYSDSESGKYNYKKLMNIYHNDSGSTEERVKNKELVKNVYEFLCEYHRMRPNSVTEDVEQRKKNVDKLFGDNNVYWGVINKNLNLNDRYEKDIDDYIRGTDDKDKNDKGKDDKGKKVKTLSAANLFWLHEDDGIDEIYTKLYLGNLSYITANCVKDVTTSDRIESRLKKVEPIFDFFVDRCLEITVMAKYIWTLLVRYKILADATKSEKTVDDGALSKEFFEKALHDAQVYSDGLYQIIENSCLHSAGKYVYYSIYVHMTNLEASGDDLIKSAQNIKRMNDKYHGIANFNKCKFFIQFFLTDNAFDFEIKSSGEDLEEINCNKTNMIEHFNNNHSGQTISFLSDLFNRKVENQEDVYIHYGLRVLEKNVLVNNGYFIAHTYNIESYYAMKKNNKTVTDIFPYSGSAYDIIVPVYFMWQNDTANNSNCDLSLNPYDIDVDYIPIACEPSVKGDFKTQIEKNEIINDLSKQLENAVNSAVKGAEDEKAEKDRRIICIKTNDSDFINIELLAKAVFLLISKKPKRKWRIAILFKNRHLINEFARIYSIFYDKTGKSNYKTEDSQIALCSIKSEKHADEQESEKHADKQVYAIPEVNMILGHDLITTSGDNARSRVYFSPNASIEFLPIADYISETPYISKNESSFQPFLFDLYLDMDNFKFVPDEYNKITHHSLDNTWFFRSIKQALNTDFQTDGYGCKIDDVCISISSKIHIDTFYYAELLFKNYGNVVRFAYIIAKEIIGEQKGLTDKSKNILLIGYEYYSNVLIQEIKNILEKYYNKKSGASTNNMPQVEYITFRHKYEFLESADENGIWPEFEDLIDGKKSAEFNEGTCYFVMPIATTLNTVQRLHDVIEIVLRSRSGNKDKIKLDYGKNTVIVLVKKRKLKDEAENEYKNYLSKIWCSESNPKNVITIKSASKSGSPTRKLGNIVKYYFEEKSAWFDIGGLEEYNYNNNLPLIGTDKTSTMPDTIFEKYNYKDKNSHIFKDYDNKVDSFLNYVVCTHRVHANNHFLFDIDYAEYIRDNKKDIKKWLCGKAEKVDKKAFNIIISPLDGKNSEFVHSVVLNMFGGNVRLLHFYINESRREEVRVKYSYITKQIEEAKAYFENIKIHVYFVDTCIVSAATIQRAKTFMHMLLYGNNGLPGNAEVFRGIITLANRSSYETIANFLPGHVEDSFFYYARLNVPSYNTNNGLCPACEYAQQYELMHKRSATNAISREYRRLQKKHSKKTVYEYEKWLDENIINSPSYYAWFMRWYFYAIRQFEYENKYLNILGNASSDKKVLGDNKFENDFNEIQRIVNKIPCGIAPDKNTAFKDIEELNDDHDKILNIFRYYIMNGHYFIRFSCMHNALCKFEKINNEFKNKKEAESELKKTIINIFSDLEKKFSNVKTEDDKEKNHKIKFANGKQSFLWLEAEWLNSYLKILSRPPVLSSYHARCAIYSILNDLLDGILGYTLYDKIPSECDSGLHKIIRFISVKENDNYTSSPGPEMKIKLFTTIVRQLSSMYSSVVFNKFKDINEYYEKCFEQFDGSKYNFYACETLQNDVRRFISMPSREKFSFDIAKLIKWSAMSAFDESKCFAIEKFNIKDQDPEKIDETFTECEKNILMTTLLENTYVIYSGIKSLYVQFRQDICDQEKLTEDIANVYDRIRETDGSDENKSGNSRINNYLDVNTIFMRFMDLRNWYEEYADKIIIDLYVNMCMYFAALESLVNAEGPVEEPYIYTDICNYMRDIAQYDQCKVVSSLGENDLTTLVTSNIKKEFFAADLSDECVKNVIYKFNEKSSDMLEGTLQKFKINYDRRVFEMLVISIPIHSTDKPGVFILLYKTIDDKKANLSQAVVRLPLKRLDIWYARNILFLRDNLGIAFSRDIVALTKMVYNFKYIKPLNNDKRKVMHISDLHVTREKLSEYKTILNNNRDALNGIKPDLLLITGDVITGGYDAVSINQNYDAAREFINELAFILWGDAKGKTIRSDWNKRIQITTGNHDYASMNELQARNKRRATISGEPITTIGTTMVKYSYFMNFMHTLLGSDVDNMVHDDLNGFTHFRRLGISVMNINTNSGVNPFRTNKVRINESAAFRLAENNKNVADRMIYIMHHTPIYEIDYVNDVYYLKNPDTYKEVRELLNNSYPTVRCDENKIWIDLIKSLASNFSNEVNGLDQSKQEELLRDILKKINTTEVKAYVENNLSDFDYFLTINSNERRFDDRCLHIQAMINELIYAGQNDMEKYSKFMLEFFKDEQQPFYMLGGHTHSERQYDDDKIGVLEKCSGIFEENKFVNNNGLSYAILEYDAKDMKKGDYKFYTILAGRSGVVTDSTIDNINKSKSTIINNLIGDIGEDLKRDK